MHIFALFSCCLCRKSPMLSGLARHSASSRFSIRVRISAAAAFVKVTIKRRSAFTGLLSSVSIFMTLSTKTAVLPEPAAAETKIFPRASIAACCAAVGSNAIFIPLFQLFKYFLVFKVGNTEAGLVLPAAD